MPLTAAPWLNDCTSSRDDAGEDFVVAVFDVAVDDDRYEEEDDYDGDADDNDDQDAISIRIIDDDADSIREALKHRGAGGGSSRPATDLSARRLARQKTRLAAPTNSHPPAILDANDASIPTDPIWEPNRLTKPVVLHGRLVERPQPDYSNEDATNHHRDKSGRIGDRSSKAAAAAGQIANSSSPFRDAMERRSVFYRLTSDTARLRSFVNALDDVLRQTKQFQLTRSAGSLSSVSPSSVSSVSMSIQSGAHHATPAMLRLADVPRLLSTLPEGEDQSVTPDHERDRAPCLEQNAPDADPEALRQLHHRNAQHVNIAAWRVQNLVTQAQALDTRIWKALYDYEQTLRGDTLQQRHQQSACLKLHKDYRRVNRALKLCLSRLSGDVALTNERSADGDGSSACPGPRRSAATKKPTLANRKTVVEETRSAAAKHRPAPVSKVGWIGPKPIETASPKLSRAADDDDEFRSPPKKSRAPILPEPSAPYMIAARNMSRKRSEQALHEPPKEEPILDEPPSPAPFYVSFVPAEVEDDTLTMYTLYEQHKEQWKKHVPWFLACCSPVGAGADDHRDDSFDDDTYAYKLDEAEDAEARDTAPLRWNRRYFPRQRRHKLSLPKKPRKASF